MLAAAAITRAPLLLGGSALPGLGSAALLSGGARLSNCADRLVRTTPLSRSTRRASAAAPTNSGLTGACPLQARSGHRDVATTRAAISHHRAA